MEHSKRDLLLLAGQAITILMQGLMALAAIGIIIALPVVVFFRDRIDIELADKFGEAVGAFPLWPVIGVLLLALVMVVMAFFFFDRLRQIIGTVGEGDPFVPANAERLSLMAWLTLGIQLLMVPATGLCLMLARWAENIEDGHVTIGAGLDLEGILMVIVLFILARVFRHGTAMREDLEGTV